MVEMYKTACYKEIVKTMRYLEPATDNGASQAMPKRLLINLDPPIKLILLETSLQVVGSTGLCPLAL